MVKQKNTPWHYIGLALVASVIFAFPTTGFLQQDTVGEATPTTSEDIQRAIEQKQEQQRLLQQQAEEYQRVIAEKQKVAASLQNELELLDAQVSKSELDLQTLDFSIEEKRLEILGAQKSIEETQGDIDQQQTYLADLVRTMYRYDQKDALELFVVHSSFSEIVQDIRATTSLEYKVQGALDTVQAKKANLEREKADRELRMRELESLQGEVEAATQALEAQQEYKTTILTDTREDEQQYNQLLEQSKQEQLRADSDIRTLQEQAQAKLGNAPGGTNTDGSTFTGNRNVQLSWPVSPLKGISAYFHDPSYPYRRYFEHPAIDIPTPQGTAISAPDDGYVARAKNAGLGYSYILIVHSNSISTVFGHVSQINVAEDTFVKKGQIIGRSGGMPGTPGAGRLTTGPHLHFEVRLNGIPVNPLDYLP